MWEIFKFELQYRAKRPATYIYFAILFLMAFCAITTDVIQVGGSAGQIKANAPTTITFFFTILSAVIGMLMASAIMGVPVIRDFEHGTASMMFTAPINKYQYLGGRFLGSFVTLLFVFSGIFFGIALGFLMPWVEADKLLPYNLGHIIQPFFVFALTNAFIMAGLFFSSGALSRKLMVVYVQGILLFIIYNLTLNMMSDWENQDLGAMLDPFGISTVEHYTRYWTVAEQNTQTVPFDGVVLWNRLLWMGLSLAVLLFTFWKFDFNLVGNASKKQKKNVQVKLANVVSQHAAVTIPKVTQHFGFATNMKQLFDLSVFYFKWLTKQIPFVAITVMGLIFTIIGTVVFVGGGMYDVDSYPTTYRMLESLSDFNIFFIIIIVFYSGELIWKERDVKMNLIHDAMPYPNFVAVGGKFMAMIYVFVGLLLLLILCGVISQAIMGFTDFRLDVYFKTLFSDIFFFCVLFTFLGFFIHTIVNHKFVGHALYVLFFIITLVITQLGFEHDMFRFASGGLGTFSDMNSFGHYVNPFSWFSLYWFGLALVMFALVLVFSVRGAEAAVKTRLKLGALRLTRPLLLFGIAAFLMFGLSGCYIYYNTNVLNSYMSSDDSNALQAAYEKTLKKYKKEPILEIVDTYVEVDLFPAERDFDARGRYILKNKTEQPISKIYLQKNIDSEVTDTVWFDEKITLVEDFSKFRFKIYELAIPVQPGDSLVANFESKFRTVGFVESGSTTQVVENGTFFNNGFFPTFGYQDNYEVGRDDDRKDNDLPEKERMPERDDPHAVHDNLFGNVADRINLEIIMSTSDDQIAIAPGYLQKEWEEDGRRYFHYKMDKPIANFFSMVSARYEVVRDVWKGDSQEVRLEIYYNKGHEYNLDRMLRSMKNSLDYFTKNFSPYQYRQLRIMEFPRYSSFAQSFSNTVPFSEGIGFMLNVKEDDVDIPYYVTAHEIAHQWWGHQVTEAGVQGNAMSSETMAQYSALMVMKQELPEAIIQKFLKLELDRYLRGRTSETKKEQPLDHVEGQGYIHYRKGSLIMYALQDYISEDSVNLALRRVIDGWADAEGPYITSDVYVDEFRKVTPDSLQYIITDMFETITLYENRTKETTYEKVGDDYLVHLDISAIKYRADSLGNESKIALNDWIDIGVLGETADGRDTVLYLQKHKIDQEEMSFDIKVNALPVKAGIDPINKLIDRNPVDNRKAVTLKEES
ncbi:MAG: ABC-2 type transport system permease protein [Paraglaciecola sp.]|jgi:ABC-2 type transport system permease protein